MKAEMPERIWAYPKELWEEPTWYSQPGHGCTEYVLASTHQRVIEALREARSATDNLRDTAERQQRLIDSQASCIQSMAASSVALETRAEAAEAALSAKDEEVKRLREALQELWNAAELKQASAAAETVKQFWRGRYSGLREAVDMIDRAALSPRTAAMEHIAQELAEETTEDTEKAR